MTACTQPGCTGSMLDGYCDICGSPAAAFTVPPPAPTIDDDDQTRAHRPTGANDASTVTHIRQPEPLEESGLSSRSRSSARLDSTALGSRRARSSGSKITKRVQSGSSRLRSARLGAGLTRVPSAPEIDAAKAIVTNPMVSENKRTCPNCGSPVGRGRDGQPGRTEGFCAKCRTPFSFTPKLQFGDLVASQYAVAGCIAHGGLGWIYLARDENVSDRWVVLKGLLNSGDADALAVAIAEQQFLAQVEHPLIVEIYNFVTHDNDGYIVMEYVGGTSLKDLLKSRMQANNGRYDPLPTDQAIAYIIEVLPAFQYLHDLGLVFCDFKPDNLIQVRDAVKLIDLGGVRRLDDQESAIYGTIGYQAPEVAQVGTTIASDIYTIGRTLLVLMMEFRGYQTIFVDCLPPVDETPLFQDHDSLYRLLAKACAPDPADRFVSIDEFRVQLFGVLREEVARTKPGTAFTSAASMLFESPTITSDVLEWNELPTLRPDASDPQFSWLSNVSVDDPEERFLALGQAPEPSTEIQLARGRAALEMQDPQLVDTMVNEILAADPWEWRAVWISALSALQRKDLLAAQSSFNAVYGQVPGELAPKLALALACERGDVPDLAESLYQICAQTDATYVATAAFGMARIRAARQDTAGAIGALDLVPKTSRGFTESRKLRAMHLYQSDGGLPSLSAAMDSLDSVQIDSDHRAHFTVQVLHKALGEVTANGPEPKIMIGNYPAQAKALHDGLEHTYRELSRLAPDDRARIHLVDQANQYRRWSFR